MLNHQYILVPLKRKVMEIISRFGLLIILLLFLSGATTSSSKKDTKTCYNLSSPCKFKKITCPDECPTSSPTDPKAKVCYLDCNSPICKAACKRKTIVLFQYLLLYMHKFYYINLTNYYDSNTYKKNSKIYSIMLFK